jgi:hypothetical protein
VPYRACRALAYAALLSAATLVSASPAFATVDATCVGCVSDEEFEDLGLGQRLRVVRSIAGDDAQMSVRHWSRGAERYQERLYAMCTPRDDHHSVLTTRYLHYGGVWRAIVIDTRVGPEK